MPFTRPTLSEIDERIKADITFRMGSQASTLKRAWTSIFARALAGAMHLAYGFMAWAYKQFFADTAEREALLQKGAIYGMALKPSEYAQGYVRVTGTNGTVVPIGTIFKRTDGVRYEVDAPITLAGAFGDVHVKALLAGIGGNYASGQPLSLESPVVGLNSIAAVSASTPGPIENGFDEETLEDFRTRYLLRIRKPPQGGSKTDYQSWALEVPGVGKAIVYAPGEIEGTEEHPVLPGGSVKPPIGSVYVYIAGTDVDNPTPSGATVIAVQNYLDARKSATAEVFVKGVVPKPVAFEMEIGLVGGYSQAEAEAQITAELKDLFLREALPFKTLRLSQIDEAISNAAAENFHFLITPDENIEFNSEEIGTVVTPISVVIVEA